MEARVGDRVVVQPTVLGVGPRTGTVIEVGPGRALRVRWDDGHESLYFPGPDCRIEPGDRREATTGS